MRVCKKRMMFRVMRMAPGLGLQSLCRHSTTRSSTWSTVTATTALLSLLMPRSSPTQIGRSASSSASSHDGSTHASHISVIAWYGLKGSVNPLCNWCSADYYGIELGPIVLMIENYRSGLLWRLLQSCRFIESGLRRAGFAGGWLS